MEPVTLMLRSLLITTLATCALFGAGPRESYAPVFFIQVPADPVGDDVRYLVRTGGLAAWFSPSQIRIRSGGAVTELRFEGANPAPRIEALEPLPARVNFLIGDESEWSRNLPTWSRIVYRDLYPGIDMVYSGDGRNLKSEFIVAPGADPAAIRLRYGGQGRARVSAAGEFAVAVAGHELREQAPLIYQQREGRRVAIPGRFIVAADDSMSFAVNTYDRSLPLVIDPIVYSTYVGGGSSDAALAMAVDASGSAYLAGYTASTNLPTLNARQALSAGGNDVFVAKLNAAGNGLVYCTYVGGSGDDRAFGIALDGAGGVLVTGSTTSKTFPVLNALQTKNGGTKNAFVFKLNAAGNALLFSTYLGGSAPDAATSIASDANGNAYVAGDANSINFPTTSLQRSNHGGQDAFLAKLSVTGSLIYSTYLGGANNEHAAAIVVDAAGTAFITGSTYSTDFPVVAAQQNLSGGGQDVFITRVAANGEAILFSTYFGGSGGRLGAPEAGQAIALDAQGNACVAGVTTSVNLPVLQPFQATRSGTQDAFVSKWTPAGALVFSTYLGGTGIDSANAVAVDSSGAVYVAGQTFSSDLPVLDSVQSSAAGDYDAFYAKLIATGTALEKLSYLGGRGADTATAIALDSAGSLYLAGWTLSIDFPLANAYQSLNAGSYGAFLTKIALSSKPTPVAVTPASGSGSTQTFTYSFSDAKGYTAISSVSVLVNATAAGANACYVLHYRAANVLYLANDANSGWLGPMALGGAGSVQNSQCVVTAAGSSASGSGNTFTLTLALQFRPAFAGVKNIYLEAYDGADSGWQQRGSWTVPGPPVATSVTPSSGSGASQTFAFAFTDTKGYAAISSVSVMVSSSMVQAGSCYLLYYRASNALYLFNDAGSSWLGPATLGGSGTLQNSQCSVTASGSSVSGSGTVLTLNLAIAFAPAFSGAKNIYMEAYDGLDSGLIQKGTWTVSSSAVFGPVSVTPSTGAGQSQAFSFVFNDPNGYTAIQSTSMLFSTSANGAGGCYLLYYRASKVLYLANDAATAWLTPITLGGSGTVQNSRCAVTASTSSATGSGNILTVNLSIAFLAAFQGTRNVYLEAYDGVDSGWVQKGTWTIP